MKKSLFESLIIVTAAIAIALVYNMFVPKPLPLIPKSQEEMTVSDSSLFADDTSSINIEAKSSNRDSIANTKILPDTSLAHLVKLKIDTVSKKEDIALINDKSSDGEFKIVTYRQMLKIIHSDKFVIVDARRPELYASSHIASAVNIFPYDEEQIYMPKLLSLPKNKTIIIYCEGGTCDLSHKIAEDLSRFGYTKVHIYEKGWEEWSKNQGIK